MPSGRFLLCWGNRHGDLRHVGLWVVADDVIDEGDLARGGRRVLGCVRAYSRAAARNVELLAHARHFANAEQALGMFSWRVGHGTASFNARGNAGAMRRSRRMTRANRYATSLSKAPRRLSTVNAITQMTADRIDPHGEAMPMGNSVSE